MYCDYMETLYGDTRLCKIFKTDEVILSLKEIFGKYAHLLDFFGCFLLVLCAKISAFYFTFGIQTLEWYQPPLNQYTYLM